MTDEYMDIEEMGYRPIYYGDGNYVIEDVEYGHSLCRIHFDSEADLTEDEKYDAAEKFTKILLDIIEKS